MICNLRILNVGEGDLVLKFDGRNPEDRTNAKEVITGLLRQGYAIMIEVGRDEKGPTYRRVKEFDPETFEYVVLAEPRHDPKPKPKPERFPASAPSIAVARTAGGYDPNLPRRIARGLGLREVKGGV